MASVSAWYGFWQWVLSQGSTTLYCSLCCGRIGEETIGIPSLKQSSCGFSRELTLLNYCFVVNGFLSSEGCGFKYSCKWDFSGLCSPFSSATGSHLCVLLLRLQLFSHYFLTVLSCSNLSTHLKNTVDLGLLHGVRGWHWPSPLSHLESAHHSYLLSAFHVLHRLQHINAFSPPYFKNTN